MATYTTNNPTSLEEQRIALALATIQEWKGGCDCGGKFCENFGCASLDEIAQILKGETVSESTGAAVNLNDISRRLKGE